MLHVLAFVGGFVQLSKEVRWTISLNYCLFVLSPITASVSSLAFVVCGSDSRLPVELCGMQSRMKDKSNTVRHVLIDSVGDVGYSICHPII